MKMTVDQLGRVADLAEAVNDTLPPVADHYIQVCVIDAMSGEVAVIITSLIGEEVTLDFQ